METSYRHKQVRAQTHYHDIYLFWNVVYWPCQASPIPLRIYLSSRHHTATNKLEPKHTSMVCTFFGMWSIGPAKPHPYPQGFTYPFHEQQGITRHVVPLLHVVSWPCVASLTHSRIYLFPPWAARNDASHITPFACGLLAL